MAGDTRNRIKNLRTGKRSHTSVNLGMGDNMVRVAVVLLPSDTILDINEKVEERYQDVVVDGVVVKNPKKNEVTRNQYYNKLVCFHCMRDPENLEEKVFESEDEVGQLLDNDDIGRVCEKYNELLVNNSNKLETMSEEDFEDLKKYLEVTPLKDLSTVSLVHLKYFHKTIVSEK